MKQDAGLTQEWGESDSEFQRRKQSWVDGGEGRPSTPAEARDYAAARLGSAYRSIQLGGPYACRWHVIAHAAGRPVSADGRTVEEAVAACLAALAAAEERE